MAISAPIYQVVWRLLMQVSYKRSLLRPTLFHTRRKFCCQPHRKHCC